VVSSTPRPFFTLEKDPVPIVQESGWAPGPVWTGAENLAPTRIRSPDRPARSQSIYRLSYPAHSVIVNTLHKMMMMTMMIIILIIIIIINKIYFSGQVTLHVAQTVNTEQLQNCIPRKVVCF
jgi:hypothetical protein